MIVVRHVKFVEGLELEGMKMIHTATVLAPQSEVVTLMQTPQHHKPSRIFYTLLKPAFDALHRQYRHN